MQSLTSNIYQHIINRVDQIDFGKIPNSKGDITRMENYDDIVKCLELIEKLMVEYKQDTTPIKHIEFAMENIELRKDIFQKAYRMDVDSVTTIYEVMCLAVVSSLSLMIASTISFVSSPTKENFTIFIDEKRVAKTEQKLLFEALKKFNESCKKGEFEKTLEYLINSNKKNLTGAGFMTGVAVFGLLLNILPMIREVVYCLFFMKARVSDYFDLQADLLRINAYNLEYNSNKNMTPEKKKKIISKQLSIADNFSKLANAFEVTANESERSANKEIISSNKRYKADEVLDHIPDSAADAFILKEEELIYMKEYYEFLTECLETKNLLISQVITENSNSPMIVNESANVFGAIVKVFKKIKENISKFVKKLNSNYTDAYKKANFKNKSIDKTRRHNFYAFKPGRSIEDIDILKPFDIITKSIEESIRDIGDSISKDEENKLKYLISAFSSDEFLNRLLASSLPEVPGNVTKENYTAMAFASVYNEEELCDYSDIRDQVKNTLSGENAYYAERSGKELLAEFDKFSDRALKEVRGFLTNESDNGYGTFGKYIEVLLNSGQQALVIIQKTKMDLYRVELHQAIRTASNSGDNFPIPNSNEMRDN